MHKIRVLQIVFLAVQVLAAVLLTAAVFGDMDPAVMSASAIAIGVGLLGNAVCTILRAVQGPKKK